MNFLKFKNAFLPVSTAQRQFELKLKSQVWKSKGIRLISGLPAKAVSAACSCFEQVICGMNYFWDNEEALSKLDMKMTNAYRAVSILVRTKNYISATPLI